MGNLYLSNDAADISPYAGTVKKLRVDADTGVLATSVTNTVAGPTTGVQATVSAGGSVLTWLSAPLAAGDVGAGASIGINAFESAMNANTGLHVKLERVDNAGASISTIFDSEKGTELPTSATDQLWAPAVTVRTLSAGDRLKVTVFGNDAGGNMGSGFTFTIRFGNAAVAGQGSVIVVDETVAESGGTTTPQSLNVTATLTPAMLRRVNKLVNVTASTTRTIVRSVSKSLAVTGALTPTIRKSVNKPLAVTSTLTASLVPLKVKTAIVNVTATGTATMRRQVGKLLTVTATGTPAITRVVAHVVAVTATLAPTMRRQTAKALAVTSSLTPTMVRQVGKLLAVTSSTTSTIRRTTNKAIAGTSALTATLIATFVPAPGGTTRAPWRRPRR
jgi:hypothetical protein